VAAARGLNRAEAPSCCATDPDAKVDFCETDQQVAGFGFGDAPRLAISAR